MNTFYYLPSAEKKHFTQCQLCHDYVDRRNLGEVAHHDTGDCLAGTSPEHATFTNSILLKQQDEIRKDEKPVINNRISQFLSQLIGH